MAASSWVKCPEIAFHSDIWRRATKTVESCNSIQIQTWNVRGLHKIEKLQNLKRKIWKLKTGNFKNSLNEPSEMEG